MEFKVITVTTTLSYWLNWRVLLCAILVLLPVFIALFMIWKYEGSKHPKSNKEEIRPERRWTSCENQAWKPCIREIHPAWLLGFRVIAFSLLLATMIVKISVAGGAIYFYYTQWTLTLSTIYFGWAVLFSIYGCFLHQGSSSSGFSIHCTGRDLEQQPNLSLLRTGSVPDSHAETDAKRVADFWCYAFEVIFQMNAGAVILTDCVYWFVIFPFLTIKDYTLNFMTINMHTLNAILLLGDTALNCLPAPWFRMSFFIVWTGVFVIFQWILHACLSVWWPYPFLDLSSPYAPLWYLLMALMHIPSYGIFVSIVKLKQKLLAKWFPSSYQC